MNYTGHRSKICASDVRASISKQFRVESALPVRSSPLSLSLSLAWVLSEPWESRAFTSKASQLVWAQFICLSLGLCEVVFVELLRGRDDRDRADHRSLITDRRSGLQIWEEINKALIVQKSRLSEIKPRLVLHKVSRTLSLRLVSERNSQRSLTHSWRHSPQAGVSHGFDLASTIIYKLIRCFENGKTMIK